jgi:hypothetical protein
MQTFSVMKNIIRTLLYAGSTSAIVAFLLATNASANCHVITPSGSGNLSGSDWANACQGFSGNCAGSAMLHGDTYYVGGGSGSGYNNSVASGSNQVINVTSTGTNTNLPLLIKAATLADHCTATGWNPGSTAVDGGAGQAIFTSVSPVAVAINTSNVTIDGNFSASDTSNTWGNLGHACSGTQCGIKVDFSVANAFQLAHFMWPFYVGAGVTNATIRSTEFAGCYTTCGAQGEHTDVLHLETSTPNPQNTLALHNYWHDSSQGYIASYNETGTTVKYNYFLRNYSSAVNPPVHGNTWAPQGGTNQVFAFNVVQDGHGTAVIDEVNSVCCNTNTNFRIYGNVIFMGSGNPAGLTDGWGNGVVSCTNGDTCIGWQVYNNTVVNETLSYSNSLMGGTPNGTGSSLTEYNNLFWNNAQATNGPTCGGTMNCTTDYDYFSGTAHTPETHEQTTTLNPFVDWTHGNFHLVADTNSGNTSLGAPFNVDMDGVPRTSTRGAYQFIGGSSSLPAPPSRLTATVQ